ncbi:hypothetical protein CBER1_03602 [Cercospora berteroae]|uniref:Uncharacterized protein n=1 Tax=Cercospora berteroae TaxID=357750 RepID=A0A2S6C8G0_9PEZI|nr:hypothetical protein CBER1_03602 [Cercospora berteroae]
MQTRNLTLLLSIALSALALPTPAADAVSPVDASSIKPPPAQEGYGKVKHIASVSEIPVDNFASPPRHPPPRPHTPPKTTFEPERVEEAIAR